MKPIDELSFWKRCCLILALVALFSLISHRDIEPEITAKHVVQAQEKKAETKAAMAHPLPYTATTTMLGKTRIYVPSQRERNF